MTQQKSIDRDDLRQADRLQTLNEIGRVVAATLDLGILYETIYQQVGRVMDTAQFFIALYRSDTDSVELVYHREEGALYLGQQFPFGNSVTSLVIERGTPLLFRDNDAYSVYARENALPEITVGQEDSEGKIWVPLNTGNVTIGAITVQSSRKDAYTLDDMQTLSVIASQAAVAIENARLYSKSQVSVRQTQALLTVARMLNSSLELQVVLDSILSGVRDVLPFQLAAILLPNHRERCLDIVGANGPLADDRRRTIKIRFGQGITGKVFEMGEPLYIGDITKHADYVEHGISTIRSEIAVPLKHGDAVVGVLDVERDEVDAFSEDDLRVLTLFASQAAIAIENARLFSEQQNRVFELHTIQTIVQKLTPLHDVADIAQVINDELAQLIDYHSCRVFALDSQEKTLSAITLGPGSPSLCLRVGEGIAGWVAANGRSVYVSNTLEDERMRHIAGTPIREESMIAAPLKYQGRVRGVIALTKLGANQFDGNALRLLEIIAAQAAIAFDRARLYVELREEAITDPLTHLYNRRYLIERFKEERSRAVRNKHSLTAIMLDIDHFKQVNDSHGHDAGDVVLKELAHLVRSAVRAEDMVARYGGEEFCVLLPEIPLVDAKRVANRLRHSIATHRMPASAGTNSITVSIGMALLSPFDQDLELFTRADLAMYEVKHIGGDSICLAGEDGETFFHSPERRAG